MNNIIDRLKLKVIVKNENDFVNYLEHNVIGKLKILQDLNSSNIKGTAIKEKMDILEKELDEFLFQYRFDVGKLMENEMTSNFYNLLPIANWYLRPELKDKLTSFEVGRIEKYIEINMDRPQDVKDKQYIFAKIKPLSR